MASESHIYREVMATAAPTPVSPFEATTLDFVFGQVWARPGISRRQRRLVTLSCVCAAGAPGPIDDHMYAALATGDLKIAELLEFTLHFAVYCGWPKASQAESCLRKQHARLQQERGSSFEPWPDYPISSLGPSEHEARLAGGELLSPTSISCPRRPETRRTSRRGSSVSSLGTSGSDRVSVESTGASSPSPASVSPTPSCRSTRMSVQLSVQVISPSPR